MNARWLVPQLGDVLVPLPGREPSSCSTNPLDGVADVRVPEPGRAVVAGAGQRAPVWAERHRVHGQSAAGQGLTELAGVRGIGDIPRPDRAVSAGAGQRLPVRLNATDRAAVPPVRGWPTGRGCAGSATSHSRIVPSPSAAHPAYFSLSHKRHQDLLDPYIWSVRPKFP